jgi:predicted MPP superfamily phosphohydrolase
MGRFVGFLALFLLCYGGLNLYVLIKARRAFYLEGVAYIILAVLILYLFTAPIQARILESRDYHVLAVVTGWIGYLWMGTLFLFVCISLPIDLYHLAVGLVRRLTDLDLIHITLSRRQSFNLTLIITVLMVLYGLYEAQNVRTESFALKSAKIPPEAGRIRIVQISDCHIGPMMFMARLEPIIAIANKAKPDLLISTGDLVDGPIHNPIEMSQELAKIPARLGKYAITGNHEFYAGIAHAAQFTQQSGFMLLRDQDAQPTTFLSLVGLEDPAGRGNGPDPETMLLEKQPADHFNILLKHRPVVSSASPPLFDLQLSGHTHNGQIFPFGFIVRMQYPLACGLHLIEPASHIYISRGSGTWGPPLRVFSPPVVTIIDLLPAAPAPKGTHG